jgi:predicted O-methyltransferase YrrM
MTSFFQRVASHGAHDPSAFVRKRGDSFDIMEMAFLKAAYEAAEYYEANLILAQACSSYLALLDRAVELASGPGLILEFGVGSGHSISHLAGRTDKRIFGFDSFEGLPEAWRSDLGKGAFATDPPTVPKNVTLVKGWFNETLPQFLAAHTEDVALLHVDCDLYSSTKTVFDLLAPRLVPGSVIVFDEYWNYPGWKDHEHKAFQEFSREYGKAYRYDSFVPSHQQVCVVLK